MAREYRELMPEGVRAAKLHIDEVVRRIPFRDFCAPADGQAMDADAIVEKRAGLHLNGLGREDFKLYPRRGDGLEIVRIGEEGEDFVTRTRKPKLGVEGEFFHDRVEITASS